MYAISILDKLLNKYNKSYEQYKKAMLECAQKPSNANWRKRRLAQIQHLQDKLALAAAEATYSDMLERGLINFPPESQKTPDESDAFDERDQEKY